MNVIIRKIEESDFASLIALFQEFAEFQKMPDKMTNSVVLMQSEQAYIDGFVALTGQNQVIGYATCFFAYYTWIGKSLYMDDLYVKEEHRANGIGSLLINEMIAYARTKKCKKLHWQVSQWNAPAISFYKSLGAIVDGVESNCDLLID